MKKLTEQNGKTEKMEEKMKKTKEKAQETAKPTNDGPEQEEKTETTTQIGDLEQKNKKLQEDLDAAQKELDEVTQGRLRLAAEYDNYRKRSIRDRENAYCDAYCASSSAFLPVLDNLERASEAGCEDGGEALRQGILLTLKQVRELCEKVGIEEISTQPGDAFDPEVHNAVMHIEDENLPQNSVAEVLQKGYKYKDRVLRPVMVKQAN